MMKMVVKLGPGGMSSDGSEVDEKTKRTTYRIKRWIWQAKVCKERLILIDSDHNVTNAYGESRPGKPPRERIRASNSTISKLALTIECHIGPLHCADCFHSWDQHNVPSSSDSRDSGNPICQQYFTVPHRLCRSPADSTRPYWTPGVSHIVTYLSHIVTYLSHIVTHFCYILLHFVTFCHVLWHSGVRRSPGSQAFIL